MSHSEGDAVEMHGVVTAQYRGSNPDSPWMAGKLKVEGETGTTGFSGRCFAEVGDLLEIVGVWTRTERFGWQVKVETGLVRMDESPDALAHLLATHDSFKGLGPKRAKLVVDAALVLSDDGEVASALVAYPDEIAARSGVSAAIVQNAAEVWGERKEHFDALAQLAEFGWSSAQAGRIVSRFGIGAPGLVKSDPYMLIGKLPRFGFRTVDVVARKMGVRSTDPLRLAAGALYCLDRIGDDGNTWTTRAGLLQAATEELRPDTLDGEAQIRQAIEELVTLGYIHVDCAPNGAEIVSDSRLTRIELGVFRRLVAGLRERSDDIERGAISFGGPRTQELLPTLNSGQAKAVSGVWRQRVSVISGSAGVGKTYAMDAVASIAEESGRVVALCAPTGKAARKLSRATRRNAQTIHRLLEPRPDDSGQFEFTRNAKNPVDADLVIVDEVSMVDVRLMRSLLDALRSDCRLLLVGDHNQIPSVGPGAILRDLLAANPQFPGAVHVLTEIVRQAGILARNTTALLDGVVASETSPVWRIERTEKGYEHAAAEAAATIVESAVMSPDVLEPFNRPLDLVWDVQVLSPMKKGELGTWALNVHLQAMRQRILGNPPPAPTPENRAPKPLVGDRVIWTKNDYTLDLFNGTQALVMGLPKGGAVELEIEDGRQVTIPNGKRDRIEVAWAMTVHKSQGSEWPFVILVASSSHWIMHDRNLLYTGAGRAAEALVILGDRAGIQRFAATQKSAVRQTFGGFLSHGWGIDDLEARDRVAVLAPTEEHPAEKPTSLEPPF